MISWFWINCHLQWIYLLSNGCIDLMRSVLINHAKPVGNTKLPRSWSIWPICIVLLLLLFERGFEDGPLMNCPKSSKKLKLEWTNLHVKA